MRRIDFIAKMESVRYFVYNMDRQTIYKLDGRELSIAEIKNAKGDIEIYVEDFDRNFLMAELICEKGTEEAKPIAEYDSWLLDELWDN